MEKSRGQLVMKKIAARLFLDRKDIADILGISQSAVYSYMNGHRRPRIKTIKKILMLAKKAKVRANVEDFLL